MAMNGGDGGGDFSGMWGSLTPEQQQMLAQASQNAGPQADQMQTQQAQAASLRGQQPHAYGWLGGLGFGAATILDAIHQKMIEQQQAAANEQMTQAGMLRANKAAQRPPDLGSGGGVVDY